MSTVPTLTGAKCPNPRCVKGTVTEELHYREIPSGQAFDEGSGGWRVVVKKRGCIRCGGRGHL
jgi:hypothetical protein